MCLAHLLGDVTRGAVDGMPRITFGILSSSLPSVSDKALVDGVGMTSEFKKPAYPSPLPSGRADVASSAWQESRRTAPEVCRTAGSQGGHRIPGPVPRRPDHVDPDA